MLSPLVSWILSPSSSSSSSSSEEEESLDINTTDESDYENDNVANEDQTDNVEDDENDHFLSSHDVDDDTIPVALAVPDASPAVTVAFPAATAAAANIATRSKRQRSNPSKYSGSVRQYQRLWTKEDEMELLKGYLDYIKHQGKSTTSLQNDVASLYDHVRPKLNVSFNKNQFVEKLRRLKRKHKMVLDKNKEVQVQFKNPQEQAIFEISHKIWGNDMDHDALDGDESRPVPESHDLLGDVNVKTEQVDDCDEIDKRVPKRLRFITDDVNTINDQNNGDAATTSLKGFIEETMRSCFPPLLKEELDDAQEGPLGASAMPSCPGEVGDEEWRKRRIVELQVYLNRLEVLQDQIKTRLEELRSSGG